MFGIINALDALQDNWLKNDHSIRVPLPSSYTIDIHWDGSNNSSSEFSGHCVVSLGDNIYVFHLACHLPSSVIQPSIWFTGFWCIQSWYTPNSMSLDPMRQSSRRSPAQARTAASPALPKGIVEAQMGRPRCLSEVSMTSMDGCWEAAWRHCLGGFWSGWYPHWRAP